jgi:protein-disulfide isomerase
VETEPTIIAEYITSGKVKLVYRHLLQIGEGSVVTAEASECAADQGQFWPMRKMLYTRQDEVYAATDLAVAMAGFAQDLGLDTTAFDTCMQEHKHLTAVQADHSAAQAEGVRSRPVFDIEPGGQRIIGAQPFASFQRLLDTAINP